MVGRLDMIATALLVGRLPGRSDVIVLVVGRGRHQCGSMQVVGVGDRCYHLCTSIRTHLHAELRVRRFELEFAVLNFIYHFGFEHVLNSMFLAIIENIIKIFPINI